LVLGQPFWAPEININLKTIPKAEKQCNNKFKTKTWPGSSEYRSRREGRERGKPVLQTLFWSKRVE
jgi:hypothetical protein